MNETRDASRAGRAIVGREREVAVVAQALDEARMGRGQLVIVRGAPGSGKTRLAQEAARLAEGRGMRVAWSVGAPEPAENDGPGISLALGRASRSPTHPKIR